MNWLLLVVVLLMGISIFRGYKKGLLRMIYHLLELGLMLAVVIWGCPYAVDYINQNTELVAGIQTYCTQEIEKIIEESTNQNTQAYDEETIETAPDSLQNLDEIPSRLRDYIFNKMGIYEQLSEYVTQLIVHGIAILGVGICAKLALYIINKGMKVADKIPVVKGVSCFLGGFIGFCQGILLIWSAFAIIACFVGTESGRQLIMMIQETPVLAWMYENNCLLWLFLYLGK